MMHRHQWAEAEKSLVSMLSRHPTNAYVLFNYGITLWESGRRGEAIQSYRRSLGADPRFLPAMVNLANSLYTCGDFREALRYAQMAVRRDPGNANLLCNLAHVLMALGEHQDALGALQDALRINPGFDQARGLLVTTHDELGHNEETRREAELLRESPDLSVRIPAVFTLCGVARRASLWDVAEREIPRLIADIAHPSAPTLNPMAFAFYSDDPDLLHRIVQKSDSPPTQMVKRKPHLRDGRMTIGYMSPDFRDHPVAHAVHAVLQAHDRTRVRLVAISLVPLDDSAASASIRAAVDEVVDLSRLDDTAAMHALHQAGVDVLVDLAGTTKWNRATLLARRPCAVQALWLGCPVSTGARYYDAYILDPVVAPPGYESYCTEPILRLPGCYHPINAGIGAKPSRLTRRELGLPDDETVIAMMQPPAKIRPPLVDDLARIVARHPRTHLCLRVHPGAVSAATARLTALGLPAERLHLQTRFFDRDDYLAAQLLPDLLIDSYPYGGHSTTGEALTHGAAVLTFLGRCIHTRVAASMLTELGLGRHVQPDMSAMLATLDRLCGDPAELQTWRQDFRHAAQQYQSAGVRRLANHLEDALATALAACGT